MLRFQVPSEVETLFRSASNTAKMSPSQNSNLVEIQGLAKNYGAFEAVKDLDLSVSYGQIFALLGPNGAGKTTTIRMLMGILAPTARSARIEGLDCFQDRVEVNRRVGYLPDEPIFHDYLRGSEIIRFSGEMHGLDPFATRALHEIIRSNAAAGKTIFFKVPISLIRRRSFACKIAIVAKVRLAAHGTLGELRARLTSDTPRRNLFLG
jgi:ABC-2 type transport system ATP-binding protein